MNGAAVAGIVISLLVLVPLLCFLAWYAYRVIQRRTHLVRPSRAKLDLDERYEPVQEDQPRPSFSSSILGRIPLLHSRPDSRQGTIIDRAPTPDSFQSNVSEWLQNQQRNRPDNTSLSYRYTGIEDEDRSLDIIQHYSRPQRPAPAPPLELSVDPHRQPQRPAPALETIYSASDSTERTQSIIGKFPPPPPRAVGQVIRNNMKQAGERLGRSLSRSPLNHNRSTSLDVAPSPAGAGGSSGVRGRMMIPPPPVLPPPKVPPTIPLPGLPPRPPPAQAPLYHTLSPPHPSGSNPFDVDRHGGIVQDSYATTRPLRPLRLGDHKKSSSVV